MIGSRPMPARAWRVALAAVVHLPAALAGCQLGPEHERPQMAVPLAWNMAAPGAEGAWPSLDWWKGFGSPQLNLLIEEALASNTDLAAAARIHQADAQARIAGAALLPSVDSNVSAGPNRLLNNVGRERHYTSFQGVLRGATR